MKDASLSGKVLRGQRHAHFDGGSSRLVGWFFDLESAYKERAVSDVDKS